MQVSVFINEKSINKPDLQNYLHKMENEFSSASEIQAEH